MNEYRNEHCSIAADMLGTEPGLLDYRLVEHLNNISKLVAITNEALRNRQVIALAIIQWQESKADDFTGNPKT